MWQRIAGVARMEDHLPAPVAARPHGGRDAVEVLVGEAPEERHLAERGWSVGGVRRRRFWRTAKAYDAPRERRLAAVAVR